MEGFCRVQDAHRAGCSVAEKAGWHRVLSLLVSIPPRQGVVFLCSGQGTGSGCYGAPVAKSISSSPSPDGPKVAKLLKAGPSAELLLQAQTALLIQCLLVDLGVNRWPPMLECTAAAAAGSVFSSAHKALIFSKNSSCMFWATTQSSTCIQNPRTDDGGPTDFKEEILLRVPTATDAQELGTSAGHFCI